MELTAQDKEQIRFKNGKWAKKKQSESNYHEPKNSKVGKHQDIQDKIKNNDTNVKNLHKFIFF